MKTVQNGSDPVHLICKNGFAGIQYFSKLYTLLPPDEQAVEDNEDDQPELDPEPELFAKYAVGKGHHTDTA